MSTLPTASFKAIETHLKIYDPAEGEVEDAEDLTKTILEPPLQAIEKYEGDLLKEGMTQFDQARCPVCRHYLVAVVTGWLCGCPKGTWGKR